MAVAAIVGTLGVSWYSRALAMSVALAFMMLTGSVHPPGAAAIMACRDQKALQDLGLAYVAYPVLFGSLFVLAMGRLCARLKREREFVLLWRWKSPFRGKSGDRRSVRLRSFLFGIVSIEKRKGHPVLYRKSAYGFSDRLSFCAPRDSPTPRRRRRRLSPPRRRTAAAKAFATR